MKRLTQITLAIVLLLGMVGTGWGATVYVSNSTANGWAVGNDANSYAQAQHTTGGLPDTPWATLAKAGSNCANGDTIIMNDGNYPEASLSPTKTGLIINGVTQWGARIATASGTIGLQPPASTTTTLGNIWLDGGGTINYGIRTRATVNNTVVLNGTKITNFNYGCIEARGAIETLTINGGYISNTQAATVCVGINFLPIADGSSMTITGGTYLVSVAGTGSASVIRSKPTTVTHATTSVTVSGATISATASGGTPSMLGINTENVPVVSAYSNIITTTYPDSTSNQYGINISKGTCNGVVVTIYNNNININHNNSAGGWTTYGVLIANGTGSGAVYKNTVLNAANAFQTGISTALLFYKNYSANCCNHYWLISLTNSFVYNNIANGFIASLSADVGYIVGSACNNVKVWNNVIMWSAMGVAEVPTGLFAEYNCVDAEFKNNIVVGPATGTNSKYVVVDTTSTATFDNNLYYGIVTPRDGKGWDYGVNTYATFALWQAAGFDANGKSEDPKLVGAGTYVLPADFKLTSASPCINAGANVGLTTDFEDKAVPQGGAPDIGAYEYNSSGSWFGF